MRICLRQFRLSCQTLQKGELWSGGRDLNLRQSGVCTLDRLNDAHHTGRRLQRLRQPRHMLGWLGSSTKLSYLPTNLYNENFQFMRFVMFQLAVLQIRCVTWTTSAFSAYTLFYLHFDAIELYSKSKILEL
jgi:hypothetical protein